MQLIWERPLYTDDRSTDWDYDAPVVVSGDHAYYACRRTGAVDFHILDVQSGEGCVHSLPCTVLELPSRFFAFLHRGRVIYYTGDLIAAEGAEIVRHLKLPDIITSHLLCGDRLLVACDQLYCIHLDTLTIAWALNLDCDRPYRIGEMARFGELVSCYGQDQLLFIEPDSGKIVDAIRIPRIDKLYSPVALDDDTLLIGYTNWTNAGILRYQRSTGKVLWRNKRRFEGPQLKCRIWHEQNRSYWVKNGTELICLNDETGDELFQLRTAPWLYTDLQFLSGDILYGTAGANGYINCLDAQSGQMKWSVFQQNGCAYYDFHKDTVLVGDFSKTVFQLSLHDGAVIDQLRLDREVVGRINVHDGCVYTVIWTTGEKPMRLVKLRLTQ